MKKLFAFSVVFLFLSIGVTVQSCKNDEPEPPVNNEFIATDQSFSDFRNWELVTENSGPDPSLDMAHGGNDSTVTRSVYFKDDQMPANGTYPVGTIIVKESQNPDNSLHELTAMVKRGNDFNPAHNDWEWFMLEPDGKIASDQDGNKMRGAMLMNGMCGGCHDQASSTDFVFSR